MKNLYITKNSFFSIAFTFLLSLGILPALAQNRSVVIEEIIKIEGIKADSQLYVLSPAQRQVTKTYLDGLGRAVQTVQVACSPSQKDIIQPVVYDNLGRQTVSYLPYVGSNSSGVFRTDALNEQSIFYNTSGQKIANDAAPYSQQVFENSPLQRVLQQGSVGAGFQPGQNYKSYAYGFNSAGETIKRWNPDGSVATDYAPTTLTVTSATDEQGGQTVVYTDNTGKTVLKKQLLAEGSTTWLETYYVYDFAGQLVYVIPPKAIALMNNIGYSIAQPDVDKLLFKYVYDERGRQVERTVPGAGAMYMVYDPLDRLVLAQDANMRLQNKWNYIKYDNRNTAISQGIYTNAVYTTRAAMQGYVNGLNYSINYYEERNGNFGTSYYSNVSFPVNDIEPLAYSYYDDYDLDGNGVADYAYQNQGMSGEALQSNYTSGLPTMVRKRSVGNGLANSWLTNVTFYDKRGNVIQTLGNNHLNTSIASSTTLVKDFTGKTLKAKTVQVATATTTVLSTYSYDHSDRLQTVDESYNAGTPIRVAAYEYNELGQLVDKKLHSTNSGASYLQSVDYRYTIQGQLSSINNSSLTVDGRNDDSNDVFGMELLYSGTDNTLGNTPYYNGLVSAVKWKVNAPGVATANERSYVFGYDKLLRLKNANYADRNGGSWGNAGAFDEKNITYDVNGNILTLQRNAILSGSISPVDDLSYSYDGNRLNNVADGSGGSYGLFGFKNLTGSTAAYGYDVNGNLQSDPKKGLALSYNVLNRTERITVTTASNRYIDYTYDAAGTLLRKQAVDNGATVKTTDYVGGFVYENGALAYFAMAEGRVRNVSGTLKSEYMIKDQQGNVRVSFEEQGGVAVVRQENSYFPFGLTMPGSVMPTAANKNLYNGGAEWQDDFADLPDLQQTFYRMYDAALGRFISVDPEGEASESVTTYHYALNNPIMFNDPLGDKADYSAFWNQALSYTTSNGARYTSSGGWYEYGSGYEGFMAGVDWMNQNKAWGMYTGWANNYQAAEDAYYSYIAQNSRTHISISEGPNEKGATVYTGITVSTSRISTANLYEYRMRAGVDPFRGPRGGEVYNMVENYAKFANWGENNALQNAIYQTAMFYATGEVGGAAIKGLWNLGKSAYLGSAVSKQGNSGIKLFGSLTEKFGTGYQSVSVARGSYINVGYGQSLNIASKGIWNKVFEAGYLNGSKVEVHYFFNSTTGQYANPFIKMGEWGSKAFKGLQ